MLPGRASAGAMHAYLLIGVQGCWAQEAGLHGYAAVATKGEHIDGPMAQQDLAGSTQLLQTKMPAVLQTG